MNRQWLYLCTGVLLTTLLTALSVEAAQPIPLDLNRLAPSYLVKVTRLTGLGPDGTRQQLMATPEGVVVPIDDFSSLAIHLTADTQAATVAYHTLQAELAPGVFVLDEAGNVMRVAHTGKLPRLIPLVGAVLSQNGEIKALGINPELLQTEPRCPQAGNRDHDD
jgi:hypothetical protein